MSYLVSNQYGGTTGASIKRPSMYETITSGGLSEEQKQHFYYEFSGSALDSIWTFTDLDGTNSGSMDDNLNGGYKIVTGATTHNRASINFNGIEHYSNTGSVIIGTVKTAESTSRDLLFGLGTNKDPFSNDHIMFVDATNESQPNLRTVDTAGNSVATTLSFDTNYKIIKMKLSSSSGALWANGTLEAISTSQLPQNALTPQFSARTRTTAARTGHILNVEAYNT